MTERQIVHREDYPGPSDLWDDEPETAIPDDPPGWPAWVWVLSVAVVCLIILDLGVWIDKGSQGYYVFQPGSAPLITASSQCRAPSPGGDLSLPNGTPCVMLGVPSGRGHDLTGSLFMVDVELGPAPAGYYVLKELDLLKTFTDGVQLVPKKDVLGTLPAGQLTCQDNQQMAGSTSNAVVVALRRLGDSVKENDLGAQVNEVLPGSAAAVAGLECNDTVVAVNGHAIHTDTALVSAIHAAKPGQKVEVTVQRETASGHLQTLTIPASLRGVPASPGQRAEPNTAFLGVGSTTLATFTTPFNVTIEVGNIGGPSAGLALTLGILDVLSNGNLTGGHKVAATGTINLDGTVGDVGGVAQKAVAVRRSGATVFLVPPQELKAAESEAGKMKVVAVSTLQQALSYLESIGGHVPPTTASHNGGGKPDVVDPRPNPVRGRVRDPHGRRGGGGAVGPATGRAARPAPAGGALAQRGRVPGRGDRRVPPRVVAAHRQPGWGAQHHPAGRNRAVAPCGRMVGVARERVAVPARPGRLDRGGGG